MITEPAVIVGGADLTTTISATGLTAVVTPLELLDADGSVVPKGGVTLAVFVTVPNAVKATVPSIEITTLAPAGKVGTKPDIV